MKTETEPSLTRSTMASEVHCWEVLDRLNNYLKIQQADLSRLLDLGTRPNYGGQWARLSRTFLWNHLDSGHTRFPKCSSIRFGQISSNVWWCTRTMDCSSQLQAERALWAQHSSTLRSQCYLVDSIVHLSSLRRMAAMCYELRFGRMSGLPGMSSLPCGPAASISSSRAL